MNCQGKFNEILATVRLYWNNQVSQIDQKTNIKKGCLTDDYLPSLFLGST